MSYTNPKYPIREIVISTISYRKSSSGHERKLAGDIIAVREPNIGAGLRELKRYIWLRAEGLEENEWAIIGSSMKGFDKRRFCIPLQRLKQLDKNFNIQKARKLDEIYQPFIPVDEETGLWLYEPTPISVMGLIYDKETGIYL